MRKWLLLLLIARPLSAQKAPRFAILDDWVREYLAAEWDAHAKDSVILERGYCLSYQLDFWAGELAYRVTQIQKPDSMKSDAHGVSFLCPKGKRTAELHVHPPQTCLSDKGPCWNGGSYSYQCLASDQDRMHLSALNEPFGMIQCDRNAIVSFWPFGKPPDR